MEVIVAETSRERNGGAAIADPISGQDANAFANPPDQDHRNLFVKFVHWLSPKFYIFKKKEVVAEDAGSVNNFQEIYLSPATSFSSQDVASSSIPNANSAVITILEEQTQEGETASSGNADTGRPMWHGRTILHRKAFFILLIPIGNVIVEAVTISFEQLGPHSFRFELACAGMALVSVILCLIEIRCKGGEDVHFDPEILGLICGVGQLVLVIVGVILMEFSGKNPLKISIYALIAAVSQVGFKIVECKNDGVSRQNVA